MISTGAFCHIGSLSVLSLGDCFAIAAVDMRSFWVGAVWEGALFLRRSPVWHSALCMDSLQKTQTEPKTNQNRSIGCAHAIKKILKECITHEYHQQTYLSFRRKLSKCYPRCFLCHSNTTLWLTPTSYFHIRYVFTVCDPILAARILRFCLGG